GGARRPAEPQFPQTMFRTVISCPVPAISPVAVSDVPRETLVEIGEMLVKAKVQNWESSYTNRDVFDGDSWSMDVKFGKDLIWSGGYMAWPDNDPTREINKIICNLCKPQKGESESRQ
ncbi:MAG: hypothetical protein II815_06045, partial [Bacteroidales bacterium]|nr:hypothetical protein [Bacteroidales bacterium]